MCHTPVNNFKIEGFAIFKCRFWKTYLYKGELFIMTKTSVEIFA